MQKEIVDIATVLGVPLTIAGLVIAWLLSYHYPRQKERREYGIKLEIIFREMEMHGYKVYSEKFELISQYASLAKEINTKKILSTRQTKILTDDSSKMAQVAHSVDLSESQKAKSVSSYLNRLWPVVEALKK
ncbi:hypothetical protein [Undibacterium sp. WLX3042]|uniref:hypothetical protein n=1 Tax=Undibacterium sp. WLX3042 TaxID=3412686 RepID=UPI003C2E231A